MRLARRAHLRERLERPLPGVEVHEHQRWRLRGCGLHQRVAARDDANGDAHVPRGFRQLRLKEKIVHQRQNTFRSCNHRCISVPSTGCPVAVIPRARAALTRAPARRRAAILFWRVALFERFSPWRQFGCCITDAALAVLLEVRWICKAANCSRPSSALGIGRNRVDRLEVFGDPELVAGRRGGARGARLAESERLSRIAMSAPKMAVWPWRSRSTSRCTRGRDAICARRPRRRSLRCCGDAGARLREINIDADPALRALYDYDVPVILLGARKVAKHRVDLEQFRRQFEEARRSVAQPRRRIRARCLDNWAWPSPRCTAISGS